MWAGVISSAHRREENQALSVAQYDWYTINEYKIVFFKAP
jgi:hypothetical protein